MAGADCASTAETWRLVVGVVRTVVVVRGDGFGIVVVVVGAVVEVVLETLVDVVVVVDVDDAVVEVVEVVVEDSVVVVVVGSSTAAARYTENPATVDAQRGPLLGNGGRAGVVVGVSFGREVVDRRGSVVVVVGDGRNAVVALRSSPRRSTAYPTVDAIASTEMQLATMARCCRRRRRRRAVPTAIAR
jgi:hypothetical protein